MVLILVNVGIGLWFIFRHESNNPNRPLLEAQMREQIAKSIEHAAALLERRRQTSWASPKSAISAATGKMDSVANEAVAIAGRLGGSATKGLQDSNRLSVLVDVPSNREQEFRAQIASIAEERPGSSQLRSRYGGQNDLTRLQKMSPGHTREEKFRCADRGGNSKVNVWPACDVSYASQRLAPHYPNDCGDICLAVRKLRILALARK